MAAEAVIIILSSDHTGNIIPLLHCHDYSCTELSGRKKDLDSWKKQSEPKGTVVDDTNTFLTC